MRATTTCSSGAGSSSPTRTTSSRRSPAPSGRTRTAGTIYANLSDSFYCNKAYDALYEQQSGEIDAAKRAAIVKQMQQMLYDDAPYVVTFYYDNLEAYRSDRFTGFVPQPAPNGALLFQYGT